MITEPKTVSDKPEEEGGPSAFMVQSGDESMLVLAATMEEALAKWRAEMDDSLANPESIALVCEYVIQ